MSKMPTRFKGEYDVVIVGCGPGGTSVAKRCAELGLDVLAVDRNLEIGTPVRCGEGLSDRSVKDLGLNMPAKCIAQEIDGAVIYSPSGKKVEVRFAESKGYIVERKIFDKWLAEEASNAGAYVQAKTNVYGLIIENGWVKGVKVKHVDLDMEIRAKVVVAADGAESVILKQAGLRGAKNPRFIDTGYEYEMAAIDIEDPRMIYIWLGTRIAPRGYVWSFPKGQRVSNVGIGIGSLHGSGKTAKWYLDRWIETRPDINKGTILEVKGGSIPVGGFMDNMVGNGILGVGDAVNQVNPIHGGGISEAIKAGRIAGEVIADAIKKGDWSKQGLDNYNKRWWSECGERLKRVEKGRELFEKMTDQELDDLSDVLKGEDLADLAHGKNIAKIAEIYAKYKLKGVKRAIVGVFTGGKEESAKPTEIMAHSTISND